MTAQEALKIRRAYENIRNNYVGWQDNDNFKVLEKALAALATVNSEPQEPVSWNESGPIDENALERIAKQYPDRCFLKGSGVLKLTGAIRQLEREARRAAVSDAQPLGYIMKHKTGADKGFSWTAENPLFDDHWHRIPVHAHAAPDVSSEAQPVDRKTSDKWSTLFVAASSLIAEMDQHGCVTFGNDTVQPLTDALHDIDGGKVSKRAAELHEKAFMPLDQATALALREYVDAPASGVVARQDPEALAEACAIAAYEASGALIPWTYVGPSQWSKWSKVASAVRGVLAVEKAPEVSSRGSSDEQWEAAAMREWASQQAALAQQKPVATVRVTHGGYGVILSTYVAYALPEGLHDLYAAPVAAQPQDPLCRYPLCQSEAEQDRVATEVHAALYSGEVQDKPQEAGRAQIDDNDLTGLANVIGQLEGLESGTIKALGRGGLLEQTEPKKATISDARRVISLTLPSLKKLWTKLDSMPSAQAAPAVPDAWREFVEDCSRTAGGMVNGNNLSILAGRLLAAAPSAPAPAQEPEGWRAALLLALFHHQGGSSPVGQPIRKLLGIGQYDYLTDDQIDQARAFAADGS